MTDKERKQLLSKMKKTAKEAAGSSTAARKVLRQTGVYTQKGNLKRAFS